MTITALKGGPELLAFLDTLPVKMERVIVRGSLRAAARVVAEEAKVRVIDPDVRDTIGVSTSARGGTITSKVRLRGAGSFKGLFLEYGTLPHFITVRDADRPTSTTRRGVRTWSIRAINTGVRRGSLKIGSAFVGASISHPGARPHPFMRPALDAKLGEAVVAASDYIRSRLTAAGLNAPDVGLSTEDA